MSAEIFQFSTAPRRSAKIKTSTRVGEDIGRQSAGGNYTRSHRPAAGGTADRHLQKPASPRCPQGRMERRAPHYRLLARAAEVAQRAINCSALGDW